MKSELLEEAVGRKADVFNTAKSDSKVEVRSHKGVAADDNIFKAKATEVDKLKSSPSENQDLINL